MYPPTTPPENSQEPAHLAAAAAMVSACTLFRPTTHSAATPPTSTQPTPTSLAPPTHSAHVTTSIFAVTTPTTVTTCIATRSRARPNHFTPLRLTQYGGVTDTSVTATRGSNGSWKKVTVAARLPTVTWSRAHSQEPVGPLYRAQRRAQCRQGTRRAKQGSTQHVRATLQPPNTTARPWIFFCGLSCIYVGGKTTRRIAEAVFDF